LRLSHLSLSPLAHIVVDVVVVYCMLLLCNDDVVKMAGLPCLATE
jgi:hypothetical protein